MQSVSASFILFFLNSIWVGALLSICMYLALYIVPKNKTMLRASLCSISVYLLLPITFVFSSKIAVDINISMLTVQAKHLDILLIAWLIGFSASLVKIGRDWMQALSCVQNARSLIKSDINSVFERLLSRTDLAGRVDLALSKHVAQPSVFGLVKATILLPPSFLTGLSTDEVEAILAHELAHIKRFDILHAMVEAIIKALLFFNPFVYGLIRFSTNEREAACDAYALTLIERPEPMATGLLKLTLQAKSNAFLLSAACSAHALIARVERILGYTLNGHAKAPTFSIGRIRNSLVLFTVPLLAVYLIVQHPNSGFDRLRVLAVKDQVCDILNQHNLYWHPTYARHGGAVVHMENGDVFMNGTLLPIDVSESIKGIFNAFHLDNSELTYLKYYGDTVELTHLPKNSNWVYTYSNIPDEDRFTSQKLRAVDT